MGWKIIVLLFSLLLSQVALFPQEGIGKSKTKATDPVNLRRIESDVTNAFENIISLWKKGKCDALYDCGTLKSCTAVSKEDFGKRMSRQELADSWETLRNLQVTVKSSSLAYATATLGYKAKPGGNTRFQTKTYEMRLENGTWRISLEKLLRFPK